MLTDDFIYLDNNATTPPDPAVIEEMLPFLTKYYGNPSSGYAFAAKSRKAVELARERLAALLGCDTSEIVFTSGGTESNNAVIHSALAYSAVAATKAGQSETGGKFATGRIRHGRRVVTTAVEHSAVLRPCQDLERRGCLVTSLGVDREGKGGGAELEAAIGQAAEQAAKYLEEGKCSIRSFRNRFEKSVLESVNDASVNGAGAPRIPNTSSFSFEGIESSAALLLLDRHGICCSAASACRTGSHDASHVLRAMNANGDSARRSLRFSFSRFNTEAEIDRAIEVVPKVIGKLRQSARPGAVAAAT